MKYDTMVRISNILPPAFVGLMTIMGGWIAFMLITHAKDLEATYYKPPPSYTFDPCYPSTYQRPQAVTSHRKDNVTYWEVDAVSYNPDDQSLQVLHFRTEPIKNHHKCKWLNRNKPAFRTAYMPTSIAINFARDVYAPMLTQCLESATGNPDPITHCRDQMLTGLSGPTPENPNVLTPEGVQALETLGIDIKKLKNVRLADKPNDYRQ